MPDEDENMVDEAEGGLLDELQEEENSEASPEESSELAATIPGESAQNEDDSDVERAGEPLTEEKVPEEVNDLGKLKAFLAIAVAVMTATPVMVFYTVKKVIPVVGRKIDKEVATDMSREFLLPPLPLNMSDSMGVRYAQVKIALVLSHPNLMKYFEAGSDTNQEGMQQRMLDVVNESISSKQLESLLTVEGKRQVRDEIRRRMNKHLAERTSGAVLEVYFVRFLVQQ